MAPFVPRWARDHIPRCHDHSRDAWECEVPYGARHPGDRDKYACFDCRRVFKRPAKNYKECEYYYDELVRPNEKRIAEVWRECYELREECRLSGDWTKWKELYRKADEHVEAIKRGGPGLSEDELEELKKSVPRAWWKPLRQCCPSCGTVGTWVSRGFEAPPQGDKASWERLRKQVQDGETRINRNEGWHVASERRTAEECLSEKQKRIDTLRRAVELGIRTSEEERKLAVIRERKGKEQESWTVVI